MAIRHPPDARTCTRTDLVGTVGPFRPGALLEPLGRDGLGARGSHRGRRRYGPARGAISSGTPAQRREDGVRNRNDDTKQVTQSDARVVRRQRPASRGTAEWLT
jgi:hypothetical protein